jgi:hypothetical protein
MTNIFNNKHKTFSIISLIGIISAFLPWVTVPLLGSISGIKGDGIITLILFAISLIVIFFNERSSFIMNNLTKIVTSINGLIFLMMMWKLIQVSQMMSLLGIGFWGTLLASGAGFVLGVYRLTGK